MTIRPMRTLRSGLLVAAVAAVAACPVVVPTASDRGSFAPTYAPLQPARPNIVVVMADDMRVDDLFFAPHLRRLARSGLTFHNSFSPYPLCCPARVSFLTGTYAHNHRVFWFEKPSGYAAFDDSRTLATSLAKAGYRTGLVGKYVNGYGKMRSRVSGRPSHRYVPRGWSDWRASLDGGPRGMHGGTYNYFDIAFNSNGRIDNSHRGHYSSAVIGDQSMAMASRFSAGRKPFFMYVNYVAPHHGGREKGDPPAWAVDSRGNRWEVMTPGRPAWVRGRFNDLVKRGSGMPRGGGAAEANISDKPTSFRQVPEPTRGERILLRDMTRQRAEAVYVMDQQIGRLVARLKRTGAWRDTVFMFTSDNGFFLGEHRIRLGKVLAHEPSLRVPFIVTGPGLRGGEARYDPITTVDVAATILDLANAAPPRPLDGMSRVPTMRGDDRGWRTGVLTEAATPGPLPDVEGFTGKRTNVGIRTIRYSLMLNRRQGNELYDLLEDPLQNRNVFADPGYRPVRKQLLRELDRLRDCAGSRCHRELSPSLQASPALERQLTRRYWAAVDAAYGWR